ncbi:uncharacterized protein LOC111612870 isoform X2 [Centruroides sculpturatus]|nr:uncharacterized protein LOC111612870 isoform X2 [Centruroides sculpturatus]
MKDFGLNLVSVRIKMRIQQENIRRQRRHEIHRKRRPNLILEEAEWMQISCIDFIQIIEMMNSSNIDVNVLRVIKRNLERGEKYIQAFMSI